MRKLELTITAKIQIYPTTEQIPAIQETLTQINKALNYISKYVFENKCFNQRKINEDTYYNLREMFGLKSQMAQSCMKTVIAKYKSAKSNGHEFALVKFKKPEYDLVWNRDYSLTKGFFSVNTLQGRIKLPYETKAMERYFDNGYSFGTAKLVNKFDKFFLHIPVTKEFKQLQIQDVNKIVGIDLGINFLATAYDSCGKTTFFNGKPIKALRAKYKYLRKEIQQKGTSSARHRLLSIGSRENRYLSDVNHQITKTLINQYGEKTLFVLEDLTGVRQATEKVRVKDRYVSVSWAYYQFRQLLEYKAQMNNCMVIAVSPKYTSQTCPKCGHIERANRDKKNHVFKCKNCSYTSNDDRIGAMNLWRKGLEYIENFSKEV